MKMIETPIDILVIENWLIDIKVIYWVIRILYMCVYKKNLLIILFIKIAIY